MRCTAGEYSGVLDAEVLNLSHCQITVRSVGCDWPRLATQLGITAAAISSEHPPGWSLLHAACSGAVVALQLTRLLWGGG